MEVSVKNFYQRYRPQKFEEVIGQDVIVEILMNSIKHGQIQNAYLFSGPRGTGKTSIAKIFSKAVNCADVTSPLGDSCEICRYFDENSEYEDIYELDAASNNSVDDIRTVIENSYFQPLVLKKKVYIIDEVHMLSKSAFNALLKTLEEPPEHVVYILATTEPQKIPATILSRCQRFDFQRVRNDRLVERMEMILEEEKIKYEKDALCLIADLAEGGVRDALTLLQKVVIGETKIDSEIVKKKLNLITDGVFVTILEKIYQGDSKELLDYWNDLYYQGINEQLFITSFQKFIKEQLLDDSSQWNKQELIRIVKWINDLENRAVYTSNLKNLIDVALLTIIQELEVGNDISSSPSEKTTRLIQNNSVKIDSLEKRKDSLKVERDSSDASSDIILGVKEANVEEILDSDKQVPHMPTDTVAGKISSDTGEVVTTTISEDSVNQLLEQRRELNSTPVEVEVTDDIQGIDYDKCLSIMGSAFKERRIDFTKKFSKIAMSLTEEGKYGLAKFFVEGVVKAASEDKIIVIVEEHLTSAYQQKNEELISYLGIEEIQIINAREWNKIKEQYLKKLKQKVEPSQLNQEEEKIVENLEKKLNMKIEIMGE